MSVHLCASHQPPSPAVIEAISSVETHIGWCASLFSRLDSPPLVSFVEHVTKAVFGQDCDVTLPITEEIFKARLAAWNSDAVSRLMQNAVATSNLVDHVKAAAEEMVTLNERMDSTKFADEMVAGEAKAYFDGLTALIGPPNHLDLLGTMRKEHEDDTSFTTSNYDITTTPRQEFLLAMGELKDIDSLPGGRGQEMNPRYSLAKAMDMPNMWSLKDEEWLSQSPPLIVKAIVRADPATKVTEDHVRLLKLTRPELLALRLYTGESGHVTASSHLSMTLVLIESRSHVPALQHDTSSLRDGG